MKNAIAVVEGVDELTVVGDWRVVAVVGEFG